MSNKLIGIVFDINRRPFLNELKNTFSHFIASLHHDDKVYIFQENILGVPRYKSQAIAQMMQLQPVEFHLGQAVKQTYLVLAGEEDDCERTIIVLTDRYKTNSRYSVVKGMKFQERYDIPTRFMFYGFGDGYDGMDFFEHADIHHCDTPSDLVVLGV